MGTDETPRPSTAETTFDFGVGPVPAHKHRNGGGWVADTANVSERVWVGPNARVAGGTIWGGTIWGGDRYAVCRLSSCLSRSGQWDFEPILSSRDDEWLEEHRFALDEAERLAREAALDVRVNGVCVQDVAPHSEGQPA